MDLTNFQRIESELATIRQAGRFDRPFAGDDIRMSWLFAACGAAITVAAWLTTYDRLVVLIGVIPILVMGSRMAKRRRHNRADRPMLWKELRNSWLAAAILVPAVCVWMAWRSQAGIPMYIAGASAVFFSGVACLVIGVLDGDRRTYLASGLSLICFGLAIPAIETQHVAIAAGLTIALYGVVSALILHWQFRNDGGTE